MNWPEIIMAHGLSAAATVIAGAMAWQKIKDRSDENKRRLEELECRCDDFAKFAERFATIANDIKWITKTLDELRKRGGTEHLRRDGSRDKNDSGDA